MDHLPVAQVPEQEDGQLLQPPDEEEVKVKTPVEKVFENHLLREMIVDKAMHQKSGLLDTTTICALRTLGIDWNDSVCKLLHKNGLPLYQICLSKQNFLNGRVRNESNTELLEQFTKTFVCSSRILGRKPTFELILQREVFVRENCDSLYSYFLACGEVLVSVEFFIPSIGGSMQKIFPDLKLPSLRKAAMHFSDKLLLGEVPQSDNIAYLLEFIFNGATALKELEIIQFHPSLSRFFESIVLPPTLRRLNLTAVVETEDIGMFVLNTPLPNLTTLALSLTEHSVIEGLLTKNLELVRFTLKKLIVWSDSARSDNPIVFRLPIMEKLESFEACAGSFLPETTSILPLETFLPNLRTLRCFNHTYHMIMKWTNGSKFSSVEELQIQIADLDLNLDAQIMGRIHLAFPNVTKLELCFTEISTAGLQYIFMEMSNLVDLKLMKVESLGDQPPTDWDSLLIGTPIEFTQGIRTAPQLWEKIQINNDEDPSIRKLTELKTFSLSDFTDDRDRPLSRPFLTDMTFHFALLKMPRLRTLNLFKEFLISKEIEAKWKMDGRILTHYA